MYVLTGQVALQTGWLCDVFHRGVTWSTQEKKKKFFQAYNVFIGISSVCFETLMESVVIQINLPDSLEVVSIQLMSISAVGNILSNKYWRSKHVTHDCCILSSSLGEYTHPQQLAPGPFPFLQLIETHLIYTFTHLSIVLFTFSCNLMETHLLFVSVFPVI